MCSSGIDSSFIQGGAHKGYQCNKLFQHFVNLSCLGREWLMPAAVHRLSKQEQQLQICQQHHDNPLPHQNHTTCRGLTRGVGVNQQSTA